MSRRLLYRAATPFQLNFIQSPLRPACSFIVDAPAKNNPLI
eukprot:UN17691